MSSKGIFAGLVSAVLMVSVSAWAMDHDDDDHHGRGHEVHGSAHVEGAVHGKKVGWHGCDVPPGQAKKVGCVAPPPPPPAHVVVIAPPPPAHVVVVAPPPPPPAHVVVVAPAPPSVHIVVKTPKLPPPPSVGLHVEVNAGARP